MLVPGLLAALTTGFAIACGGHGNATGPTSPATPALPATLVFTNSPADPSAIDTIIPLGNLNPPDHTLPTDHIYFEGAAGLPVSAPAGGVVQLVQRGADDTLVVQAAVGVTYHMAHLIIEAGIVTGTSLRAFSRPTPRMWRTARSILHSLAACRIPRW